MSVTAQLALVAIDPESGKVHSFAAGALPYALAGALVIDLLDDDSIAIDGDGHVTATAVAPPVGTAARVAWESIGSDGGRTVRGWVVKQSKLVKHLVDAVYGDLTAQGLLRDEGKRMPLTRERYELLDLDARQQILGHLGAIIDGTETADASDIAVLALVVPCRLTKVVHPEVAAHTTASRIKEIVDDSSLDKVVATQVARSAAGAAMGAIAGAAGA